MDSVIGWKFADQVALVGEAKIGGDPVGGWAFPKEEGADFIHAGVGVAACFPLGADVDAVAHQMTFEAFPHFYGRVVLPAIAWSG